MKKTAFISGANKGIGFEIARELGVAGFTIFLGARNPALGEDAASKLRAEGLDVRFVELDLDRLETAATAAAAIEAHGGKLDVLVNNAGIVEAGDGPPSTVNLDAARRTMDVNFFGMLAVTQAMLPLLRKASAARIVNLSSGLGSITLNGDPSWDFAPYKYVGYNASKAAVNMLTVQLAYELRETAIKVNAVNPGYTATDINGNKGT
jgi:NAD(P)-dependent dehydrogenase (short-subunit alcohol dehydrogenase family)